jgi:hypothetical protein
MDLIQQDAVTQPTGIDLRDKNKSNDNNSDTSVGENGDYDDGDDDDDIGGPSNLNTNTGNNNANRRLGAPKRSPQGHAKGYICSIVLNTLYFYYSSKYELHPAGCSETAN